MTYTLTIFAVDNGGNILSPIVVQGVDAFGIDEAIETACRIHDIKQVDTVMMNKESE